MPILMRNQPLQMDNSTLISLLTNEKDRRLTAGEAEQLAKWKQEHVELAKRIDGWNNVATLQQLLEEYIATAMRTEALWLKLQHKIKMES